MDFHKEFAKSIKAFPGLEGLIFVDPDGEAILYEAPGMDPYDVQLAGARVPILHEHYRFAGLPDKPKFIEFCFRKRYLLSISLKQSYSITAIGRSIKERVILKEHLLRLAKKFNDEIV